MKGGYYSKWIVFIQGWGLYAKPFLIQTFLYFCYYFFIMEDLLYLQDSYMKEFEAVVESVKDDKYIVLDKTAFYPNSGGQPHDTGKLIKDNEEFNVVFVGKFGGKISHEVDKPGLKQGDKVKGVINWDRRYKFMRSHTAAHIVSTVIHNETNALVTGNQISEDKVRFDFNLEKFDRDAFQKYIDKANEIIQRDLEVKSYVLDREEAMKIPDLFKLAKGFPEDIKKIRIVEIGDFDKQADGGTHVKSTKEIGKLELIKLENKGKNNRRMYYGLRD